MSQRYVLVVASQCDDPALSFLPMLDAAARDVYDVLTDRQLGECAPALPDGVGLLVDPTAEQVKATIVRAYRRAADERGALVLAYIGHGVADRRHFYLRPKDAVSPEQWVNLVATLETARLAARGAEPDGLLLLIDACYSGQAVGEAALEWALAPDWRLRFEILSGAGDSPAYACEFSRGLVAVLRAGLASAGDYLDLADVEGPVRERCGTQSPVRFAISPFPGRDEQGLHLARNALPEDTRRALRVVDAEVTRLTETFQPTEALAELVRATIADRCVALEADAGMGKSALAATLARPEASGGVVPPGFVQAVAFITNTTSSVDVAQQLVAQLLSVPGFRAAHARARLETPSAEWQRLDVMHREVLVPLRWLGTGVSTRLVIDGLDQLPDGSQQPVHTALDALGTDPGLAGVWLVVTSRPDTARPASARALRPRSATEAEVQKYLAQRDVRAAMRSAIVERVAGSWLVASRLADVAINEPDADPSRLPVGLSATYDRYLGAAGAREEFATLSVAGTVRA